ncbi:MAG: hypothetical protein U9Q63_01120 [Patescibacteria group bacterium]|nr:hypothetical protein [Patescibacteria group bacterium]
MKYYRDSVTSLSWEFLKELNKEFKFVLIGGWAVWLYTEQLKSKDIDIVVGLSELGKLREKYDFSKNERLKKYEFRKGEVQVDVYSVYFSKIGMEASEIIKHSQMLKGFKVPKIEVLMALKLTAWVNRRGSSKGRKDFLDLISLMRMTDDTVNQYMSNGDLKILIKEIKLTTKVLELGLNNHKFAKSKKKWLKYLGE